jgi:hypothetical protein
MSSGLDKDGLLRHPSLQNLKSLQNVFSEGFLELVPGAGIEPRFSGSRLRLDRQSFAQVSCEGF